MATEKGLERERILHATGEGGEGEPSLGRTAQRRKYTGHQSGTQDFTPGFLTGAKCHMLCHCSCALGQVTSLPPVEPLRKWAQGGGVTFPRSRSRGRAQASLLPLCLSPSS